MARSAVGFATTDEGGAHSLLVDEEIEGSAAAGVDGRQHGNSAAAATPPERMVSLAIKALPAADSSQKYVVILRCIASSPIGHDPQLRCAISSMDHALHVFERERMAASLAMHERAMYRWRTLGARLLTDIAEDVVVAAVPAAGVSHMTN